MSVPPPGAKPTIKCIGLAGQVCALAGNAALTNPTPKTDRPMYRNVCIANFDIFVFICLYPVLYFFKSPETKHTVEPYV